MNQLEVNKKQTMESLRKLTIEETYELADAILDNDLEEVKKEIGSKFKVKDLGELRYYLGVKIVQHR